MADETRGFLLRQLDIAWKLTGYHLDGLTTEECLWRPASAGLQTRQRPDGRWEGEWPEHEGYDLGPPTIGWITWHRGSGGRWRWTIRSAPGRWRGRR